MENLTAAKSKYREIKGVARAKIDVALSTPQRVKRAMEARAYASFPPASETLRRDGYAPWLLPQSMKDSLLAAYTRIHADRAAGLIPESKKHTGKKFFRPDLSPEDIAANPIFIEAALNEELLLTLIGASGYIPHLEAAEVMVSDPVPDKLAASQLWHRDINDAVILKLFIYLSDVEDKNGPFHFIPRPTSERVPFGLPHYSPDSLMERHAPRTAWTRVKGRAGDAFLIDTHHCFHCGSRCEEQRIAYIATFSAGVKYMPQSTSWRNVMAGRTEGLSPLQRRVLDL